MATTGFWPVKGRLKDVLDYAENPDKTIDRRYLDDDLAQALRYVENPEKTDQQMYVSAINCRVEDAYSQMQETKRRYGKEGRNVAYHGFQSFRPGEVTPEECHQIGLETAREMWGDYEVVVTTHLNTDSLHNHFVVNSVSCKTGLKYHNHRKDHYRLREISDSICMEHGLSVLQNARFYGGEKGAYWVHKSGRRTHRDILKEDIEYCLSIAGSWEQFEQQLRGLGYTIDWQRFSVKAKDWERAVRMDRMGYSKENIQQRLRTNLNSVGFLNRWNSNLPYRPKGFPLLSIEQRIGFEITHCKRAEVVVIDVIFFAVRALLGLVQDPEAQKQKVRPLSPSLRMELAKLDQIDRETRLLGKYNIHTDVDLHRFMDNTKEQIALLEHDRQGFRNQLRRPKSPEIEQELKAKRDACTEKLKPLREKLRCAENILKRSEKLYEILLAEREAEKQALRRERNRERTR